MNGRKVYKCDKVTMKVLEVYPSIKAAADANGLSRTNLCDALHAKTVGRSPHVYRFAEDWDQFESMAGKRGRPVLRLDLDTGEVVTFPSANNATTCTGAGPGSVHGSLKYGHKVLGRYVFKYAR